MKRIVITGLGAITPIGNDPETFWCNLVAGKSGAGKVTQFDTGDMPYNLACEVKNFDTQDYMDRKLVRRTARATQFAIAAAKQALSDSGVIVDDNTRDDIGVMMATGGGGISEIEFATQVMEKRGWKAVGPFVVPSAMANAVSCLVSMEVGARGPVMTSTAACASGHYSILEGYHFLQRGEADVSSLMVDEWAMMTSLRGYAKRSLRLRPVTAWVSPIGRTACFSTSTRKPTGGSGGSWKVRGTNRWPLA